MSRIQIDPKMQPPTAQKLNIDEDLIIEKGIKRDEDLLHAVEPEDVNLNSLSSREGNASDVDSIDRPDTSNDNDDIEIPKMEISIQEYLVRSKNAYDASTSYFDNNIRGDLENNIRAFHNQHKSDSHFSKTNSAFTSKIYRPKTRSAINKYEAAADTAFFSNPDVISIEAENPSDKHEVISAACTKALIQYRLTKTIPWYQIVIGGFQDAQVQGLAVAHYYWKVRVNDIEDEYKSSEFIEDKPCIDLIPIENFRFDPNADWVNIVDSSPYIIYLRPMFIGDIKTCIDKGYFNEVSEDQLLNCCQPTGESTRIIRNQSGQDPRSTSTKEVNDYEVAVVQEHIHRINGEDYVWFTLNNEIMLKDPTPIADLYFTGKRQFVVGQCIIETHNPYSTGTPELVSGIQEEINEIANQRLNNVKLALNKKYIIKTDSEVDLSALLRNQPGSAVFTQDPASDVREISTPDVTQSSYLEQDRLNADFDELVSNFNPNSVQQKPAGGADTWRGMQMLNSNANIVLEHQLRVFSQTFVEPLLRGLIKLEAKYETDETIFALISQQQQKLLIRYGQQKMTDQMLNHDLVVKVNVGMNNTDPLTKTSRLVSVIGTLAKLMASPEARAFDIKEVSKELFANAGYGDGMRFVNQEMDPQVVQLMKQNQLLKQKLLKGETAAMAGIQKGRESNQTKLAIATMKEKNLNAKYMADKAFEVASQNPLQASYQQEDSKQKV